MLQFAGKGFQKSWLAGALVDLERGDEGGGGRLAGQPDHQRTLISGRSLTRLGWIVEAIFSCGIVNILRQSSVRAPYAMSLKMAMFTKNIVQIVTTVQCLQNIGFIRLCLEYGSNVTFYVRILDHKNTLIYCKCTMFFYIHTRNLQH